MEDEEEKQFGSGGMESNPPIELEEIEDKEKQLEKVVAKSNPPQLIVQKQSNKKEMCEITTQTCTPYQIHTLNMTTNLTVFQNLDKEITAT